MFFTVHHFLKGPFLVCWVFNKILVFFKMTTKGLFDPVTHQQFKNNTLSKHPIATKVSAILTPHWVSFQSAGLWKTKSSKPNYTYRVLMERRGANSPLLIVCSLLSYSDSRLRFCRSWKVLTLKQLILLAFSSLKHTEEPFSICYLSVFVLLI